jgi:hypothetical protein
VLGTVAGTPLGPGAGVTIVLAFRLRAHQAAGAAAIGRGPSSLNTARTRQETRMPTITASVGRSGVNHPADVTVVQELLNHHIATLVPLMPVTISGTCDPQTMLMIEEFQRRVLRLPTPDGRVDPGGRTIRALGASAAGTSVPAPAGEPVLDGSPLPAPAATVLKEILKAAGLSRATVTSVSRTPAEQARVMYENCLSRGVAFNKAMYAAAGDQVVDVFAANERQPRQTVIELMLAKIMEVGPAKVSRHCSETHFTFDVAPSSIPTGKRAKFLDAIKAHQAVSKVIPPPTDPAYHIEIPRDAPHV